MDAEARTQGDVLTGRYVLQRRLGAGGAGVVWQAHDRVLERAVAVKLLHPDLAHDPVSSARFRAEATSAAKLTHPNAVVVYDIGRDGDRDFLVMELVDGPSLADLIEEGPLPASRVVYVGYSVASALGVAHARGMLHRDVKPANVLLTTDGIPKVADFGIARALGATGTRLTDPGSVVGTARYLAPEQLLDESLDGRVDVYALGLILSEALTGQPPWGEGTPVEIASRRLAGNLPPPSRVLPDLAPGIDAVVQRATRLAVDERYEDGAAMAAALAPLVGRETARQHPATSRRERPADRGGRRPVPPPGQPPAGRHAPTPGRREPTPSRREPTPIRREPTPSRREPTPSRREPTPGRHERTSARSQRPGPREGRRKQRGLGRRLLGAAVLLLVGAVGALGLTDASLPGVEGIADTIRDSPAGEMLRDVRDRVTG